VSLGEKATEYVSSARDLNPPTAKVIIGSVEIVLAELAERAAAPPSQPTAEARGANDMIADR
jgi:hypothetical protein